MDDINRIIKEAINYGRWSEEMYDILNRRVPVSLNGYWRGRLDLVRRRRLASKKRLISAASKFDQFDSSVITEGGSR
jgi:hypothetical protein